MINLSYEELNRGLVDHPAKIKYKYHFECDTCGYEFIALCEGTVTDCPKCKEVAGAWATELIK